MLRFEREIADVIHTTMNCFGRLDITVNNAGTEGRLAPIVELGATQYADTFGRNVLATLLSMKHELRVMQRQRSGVVINVASHFGDRTVPKSALYIASECAIIGLTRAASVEAAPFGIRVHAVGPEYDADAITARVAGSPDNHSAAANRFLTTAPQRGRRSCTSLTPRRSDHVLDDRHLSGLYVDYFTLGQGCE